MVEEGERELLDLAANTDHPLDHRRHDNDQGCRAAIEEFLAIHVAPEWFDRVDVRNVARQPHLAEPAELTLQVALHDPPLLSGQAAPHPDDPLPPKVTSQPSQQSDKAFHDVAEGLRHKISPLALDK